MLTPSDKKFAPDSIALDSDKGLICFGLSPNKLTLNYTSTLHQLELSYRANLRQKKTYVHPEGEKRRISLYVSREMKWERGEGLTLIDA